MSETNYDKYGYSKNYKILDGSFLQFLISDEFPPPEKLNPEQADFLVHIKYEGNDLDDNILLILEKVNDIIKRKSERDPSGKTDNYKIRIDTDKIISGSNIYIRDENKDPMEYMSLHGLLTRLIGFVLDELDAIDGENSIQDDEQTKEDSHDSYISEN